MAVGAGFCDAGALVAGLLLRPQASRPSEVYEQPAAQAEREPEGLVA